MIFSVVFAALIAGAFGFPADDCANKPADVVFILDSSNSIWLNDFYKQTEFVRDVVENFDIGSGASQTRVGVLTFGHAVWKQFDLNDKFNKADLMKSVENIKHGRGRMTNTGDAINYALDNMFTPSAGSRIGVTRVVIVITDGRSQKTYATKLAARRLHESKVNTFAIGVGRNIDLLELQDIASNPDSDYMFMVDDFNALSTIKDRLARKACEVSTPAPTTLAPTTPESIPSDQSLRNCDGKPADVFIVIDSSSSISNKDFNREISFVQSVVKLFDIGYQKTRVGIVSFSHDATMILALDNNLSKPQLLDHISRIQHMGGGTETSEALRLVRQVGFSSSVARTDVAKIAIVLTDGLSLDAELTAQEARFAHSSGIKVFAIGIGYGADLTEIKGIASDPDEDFVFTVNDFSSLTTIHEHLAAKTCKVKPENINKNKTSSEPVCQITKDTDVMFIYDTKALGVQSSKLITEFLAKIVARLDLHSGHLQIGRITDNCPSGGSFQLSSKTSAIDFSEIHLPSYTELLKKVRRSAFSSEYGGRSDASNVAVLFVDSEMQGLDDAFINEAANMKNDANVFTITIGDGELIAKFNNNFKVNQQLRVNSYTDLDKAADEFLEQMCNFFIFDSLDYTIDYVVPL